MADGFKVRCRRSHAKLICEMHVDILRAGFTTTLIRSTRLRRHVKMSIQSLQLERH